MLIESPPAVVRIDSQYQEHQRRTIAKIELLKAHPYCSGCGHAVVAKAGNDNSASLVIDVLSCPACVDKVRRGRMNQRSGGDKRNRPNSTTKRLILKQRLYELSQRCTNCKRHIRFGAGENAPDSVNLVVDRLSCFECVRTVRSQIKAERSIFKAASD